MTYNYSKLQGRIVEIYGSQKAFAEELGLSERSLSLKLNNKVPWTQPEISKVQNILQIDDSELKAYFFDLNVQRV